MAERRWSFKGQSGAVHVVELVHGFWSGKRRITVDGALVVEATTFLDGGSHHDFAIDGKACVLAITCPTGIMYRYALRVDGVELLPDDARAPKQLPAVGTSVPVSPAPRTAPPPAEGVAVKSRFIDFERWFKGER